MNNTINLSLEQLVALGSEVPSPAGTIGARIETTNLHDGEVIAVVPVDLNDCATGRTYLIDRKGKVTAL